MTCIVCGQKLPPEPSVTLLGATHHFDCSRRAAIVCRAIRVAEQVRKHQSRFVAENKNNFLVKGL